MADSISTTYKNKNPLIQIFSRTKVNIAVRIANLKKEEKILDFGCGEGWLKNKLKSKGYNVIGYDVTPSQSDIDDYKKTIPDKIFVLDVFEHIPKEEISKIIVDFKRMNPKFILITAIPTENFVSRKVRKLLGKSERVKDHITTIKEILEILNKELILKKRFNFLTVSKIFIFKNKN
jgi:cyclopropane fatty-acyl-phospholipid synthase-like methyltransferase